MRVGTAKQVRQEPPFFDIQHMSKKKKMLIEDGYRMAGPLAKKRSVSREIHFGHLDVHDERASEVRVRQREIEEAAKLKLERKFRGKKGRHEAEGVRRKKRGEADREKKRRRREEEAEEGAATKLEAMFREKQARREFDR